MSGWWLLVGLILGLLLMTLLQIRAEAGRSGRRPAEWQVEADYRQARAEMNQAAGQSWRDLTD